MITIGIPVRNGFAYVSKLLRSIEKNTKGVPLNQAIIIDDGSAPPVEKLNLPLKGYKIIRNEKSQGFPAACNQIIREAKNNKYICILNSDTVVAPRWLLHLYSVMEEHSDIGICGPSTSYANDPQCRRDICGARHRMFEADINKYAHRLERQFNSIEDIGSVLTGFCMMIRASALKEIGLFDEKFGLGSFEEADLCKRMMGANYRCIWVPYAYVHHYGKGTFGTEKIDWPTLWANNQKRFEEKWKDK